MFLKYMDEMSDIVNHESYPRATVFPPPSLPRKSGAWIVF